MVSEGNAGDWPACMSRIDIVLPEFLALMKVAAPSSQDSVSAGLDVAIDDRYELGA